MAPFRARLDPEQHPPLHEEVRDLHQDAVCDGTEATRDTAAGDQAASVGSGGFDDECGPALEPECASGLEHTHTQPTRRMEVQ
jgi:hypothetical protein